MLDYSGVEIQVGDEIAYPIRKGSGMWLTSGFVVEIGKNHLLVEKEIENNRNGKYSSFFRTFKITATERVVVLQ